MKYKKLRPIRPSAGLEMAYRKKLMALINEMNTSVSYWLSAAYKKEEPKLAQDELPATNLSNRVKKLRKRFYRRFNEQALSIARWFVEQELNYTGVALKNAVEYYYSDTVKKELVNLGLVRDFKQTPELKNVARSFINENVNLIKSIPEKYFTEVEGMVMRAVRDNRQVGWLTDELNKRYNITKRRAAMIARDQSHKATEQINRTRQKELGVKKGLWQHATAVKEPRHSHELANGKVFDLDKGLLVDGEYIFPGEKINCHCFFIPLLEDE